MSTNTENLQQDSYEESFSNLTNVSSRNRLGLTLVDNLSSTRQETENRNKDFINGVLSESKGNKVVDYLFSIENNNNMQITVGNVESILSYKTAIIEGKFSKLNNKLNAFLSVRDNHKFLQETILKKLNNLNEIVRLISSGIEEKTEEIKNKSFENVFKKEIYENRGKYFNKITNYFINNSLSDSVINTIQNISFLNPESDFLIRNFTNQDSLVDIAELQLLEESLIKIEKDYPFRYVKPIKNTSSDLVIQSIINFTRSLYTISTNSFLNNYTDNNALVVNFEEESLKNYTSERIDFDIFNFINPDLEFTNLSRISQSRKLRQISEEYISLNNNYLNNQDLNFLQRYDSNEATSPQADRYYYYKYKNRIYIENNNDYYTNSYNGNSALQSLDNFCLETNKFFIDSIYNIDYSGKSYNFSNLYDDYYQDLHNVRENFNGENISSAFFNDEARRYYSATRSPFRSLVRNIAKSDINFTSISTPDIKKIYYKDQNFHKIIRTSNNNRENINNIFIEKDLNINEINFKVKLDNLVKSVKRKNLKNNEINLNFAKKIIGNIQNKKNQFKHEIVSYSKNNKNKMSLLTEDNELYDLMFTEEADINYSHTDIVSNHKINNEVYRGIDSLKRNNKNINENRENVKNNLKNLTSLYYPKCRFFSSSTLYHNIINDIIKEQENKSTIDNSILQTQALYLNFFKNNIEGNEGKNNSIRRFLKSAIMKDINASENLKNKIPDDYQYKHEDFDINDYDKYSKNSVKNYIENILDSSPRLESIKKYVFSNKNIRNLSDQSNYKCFAGLDFLTNKNNVLLLFSEYGEYFIPTNNSDRIRMKNSDTIKLTGNMYFTVFPFHLMKYNYVVYDNVKDMLQLKYSRIEKNKIDKKQSRQNDQDNDRTNDSPEFVYIINENGLDITKSNKIKIRILPKFNDMLDLRERGASIYSDSVSFPHVEIEDFFEEATKKDNSIFSSIIKSIQDFLKISNKDYVDTAFNSEEKVNNFIDQNLELFSYVQSLIEVYADLYIPYFNRIQRSFAMKKFEDVFNTHDFSSNIKLDVTSTTFDTGENDSLNNLASSYTILNDSLTNSEQASFDLLVPRANRGFSYSIIENINGTIDNFSNYKEYDNIISDLVALNVSSGVNLLEKSFTINKNNTLYTSFTQKLENIGKSLYMSDVLQAVNLDIINGCIDYQDDIFENLIDPEQELDSDKSFDKLRNILPASEVDQIEEKFYDTFYINCLSKSLYESININKKIEKRLKDGIEEDQNFFKNPDLFREVKQLEIENLNSSFTLDSNENSSKQLSSSNTPVDHVNSSFYMFGLTKNQLENIDYSSIIKFTVNVIDKFNLNHVYVPKTFLFSPLYTNVDNILQEDFPESLRSNNSIGYYRLNNNINSRLGVVNFEAITRLINSFELGQGQDFMFANIANKLKISVDLRDTEGDFATTSSGDLIKISNLYRHLINCHANSKENLNIVKTLYSLNSPNFKPVTNDQKIVDSISLLTNKEFFNIFDNKKDKSILNGSIFYSNVNEAVVNNDIVYDFVNNLSKIGSYEEIYNTKYYEIYAISVNPKDFYYFDLSNENNLEDFNETNATRYFPTNIENTIRENFGDNNIFFKSNKNLENLSINVKVEII